jgi:hypothetical protein
MPEKPFTPPFRKPVSEFPTPDPSVAFYTELVNRDDPAYMANAPVSRGALYANMVGAKREVIATYPNLFFLRERKFQLDDQRVLWDWATDENAHDTYNAEVNYVANAVTFPAFTRTYTVRRELYESDPTSVIGSPLPGIIAVEITSPGKNHTEARGVIDGTSVAIKFTVSPEGGLINGVITNTGETLIQNGTPITIIGDGQDSSAIAVTQPVGCVLTAQKKEELPEDSPLSHELVKVTRVYETLPGPWIETTRFDVDGMIIKSKTRRQVADFITDSDLILNGEWVQTWHKGTDNFVAEENIESRPVPGNLIFDTKIAEDGKIINTNKILIDVSTAVSEETLSSGVWNKRFLQQVDDSTLIKVHQASNKVAWQMGEARDIPGNPMETTRVEEDGKITTITKTLSDASTIVSSEVISGGNWIRTHEEEVSDLVAWKVVESRPIPGNPLVTTRIEEDGIPTTITKILKDTTTIVSNEVISAGQWIKTFKEEVSDLVAYQVEEKRAIPGNPIPDTELDKDGVELSIVRTLKRSTSIVTSEVINAGVWMRTESDPVGDLVSWEKVTARIVPGNVVPSANVDQDHEVATISTLLRDASLITPSASESGGYITTIEQKEVTDLVSDQVTTRKKFLDSAFYSVSIINLIPREFMAFIPTKVESHILAGTASAPTIGFLEFEVSEKQQTELLYERRVTTIDAPTLPITHTNQETTEEYGGGVLNITYTLAILGSIGIDQGLLVVDSRLTDLGNGMVVKETRVLPDANWPGLPGTDVDPVTGLAISTGQIVVDAGTPGGIISGYYTDSKPIDKWRSRLTGFKAPDDPSPLNRDYATVVNHAFPNTLIDVTLDAVFASDGCSTVIDVGLSYTLLQGYRGACDGHIYEVYTNGPPSALPTVTKFFPQSYIKTVGFANACGSRLFARIWEFDIPYSLHDLIVVANTYGTITIPATSPTALPPSGTEITIDIQTERWKYGIYVTKIINVIMP